MVTVKIGFIKHTAKQLIGDSDNIEYIRGICELIADIDAKLDMDCSERAIEIAKELGIQSTIISKIYNHL
jgi:hypothetical protein